MDNVAIGKRVRQIRKENDMFQQQFAKEIGVSDSLISSIELGRQELAPRTMKYICMRFKISERWLLTGEGEMHQKADAALVANLMEVLKDYPAVLKAVRLASETMTQKNWEDLNKFIETLGG